MVPIDFKNSEIQDKLRKATQLLYDYYQWQKDVERGRRRRKRDLFCQIEFGREEASSGLDVAGGGDCDWRGEVWEGGQDGSGLGGGEDLGGITGISIEGGVDLQDEG